MPLKPFSLTHVVYSSDDPLGPIWALLSLAPPFCVVSLTTVILIDRDLRAAFVLAGLVIASIISTILKKLIDQPRPHRDVDEDGMLHVPSSQEEGMPSNHAAFVTFAAIFVLLFSVRRCDRMQGSVWVKIIKRWGPPAVALLIAVGCTYSRVHLGYHTPNQVYAGAGLGLMLGGTWYYLYEAAYITKIQFIEQLPLLSRFDFRSPHDIKDVPAERRNGLDGKRKFEAQTESERKIS